MTRIKFGVLVSGAANIFAAAAGVSKGIWKGVCVWGFLYMERAVLTSIWDLPCFTVCLMFVLFSVSVTSDLLLLSLLFVSWLVRSVSTIIIVGVTNANADIVSQHGNQTWWHKSCSESRLFLGLFFNMNSKYFSRYTKYCCCCCSTRLIVIRYVGYRCWQPDCLVVPAQLWSHSGWISRKLTNTKRILYN